MQYKAIKLHSFSTKRKLYFVYLLFIYPLLAYGTNGTNSTNGSTPIHKLVTGIATLQMIKSKEKNTTTIMNQGNKTTLDQYNNRIIKTQENNRPRRASNNKRNKSKKSQTTQYFLPIQKSIPTTQKTNAKQPIIISQPKKSLSTSLLVEQVNRDKRAVDTDSLRWKGYVYTDNSNGTYSDYIEIKEVKVEMQRNDFSPDNIKSQEVIAKISPKGINILNEKKYKRLQRALNNKDASLCIPGCCSSFADHVQMIALTAIGIENNTHSLPVIGYSWPAHSHDRSPGGFWNAYNSDIKNSGNATGLTHTLEAVQNGIGNNSSVHIITHSRGAALLSAYVRSSPSLQKPLGSITMVAADEYNGIYAPEGGHAYFFDYQANKTVETYSEYLNFSTITDNIRVIYNANDQLFSHPVVQPFNDGYEKLGYGGFSNTTTIPDKFSAQDAAILTTWDQERGLPSLAKKLKELDEDKYYGHGYLFWSPLVQLDVANYIKSHSPQPQKNQCQESQPANNETTSLYFITQRQPVTKEGSLLVDFESGSQSGASPSSNVSRAVSHLITGSLSISSSQLTPPDNHQKKQLDITCDITLNNQRINTIKSEKKFTSTPDWENLQNSLRDSGNNLLLYIADRDSFKQSTWYAGVYQQQYASYQNDSITTLVYTPPMQEAEGAEAFKANKALARSCSTQTAEVIKQVFEALSASSPSCGGSLTIVAKGDGGYFLKYGMKVIDSEKKNNISEFNFTNINLSLVLPDSSLAASELETGHEHNLQYYLQPFLSENSSIIVPYSDYSKYWESRNKRLTETFECEQSQRWYQSSICSKLSELGLKLGHSIYSDYPMGAYYYADNPHMSVHVIPIPSERTNPTMNAENGMRAIVDPKVIGDTAQSIYQSAKASTSPCKKLEEDNSPSGKNKRDRPCNTTGVIVGSTFAGVTIVCLATVITCCCKKHCKKNRESTVHQEAGVSTTSQHQRRPKSRVARKPGRNIAADIQQQASEELLPTPEKQPESIWIPQETSHQ